MKRHDAEILLDTASWKEDLPKLCTLLGLEHKASTDYVEKALVNAFSPEAITAAGFVPYNYEGKIDVWCGIEDLESGSVCLKIRIPMQYDEQLSESTSRHKHFEMFVKNELCRAFGVPESFLNPEIHIYEINKGSVIVGMIMTVSTLTLIYVGANLPQTPTWHDKKFEILMALGGMALGSGFGVVANGPTGAAYGACIGTACAFIVAWFVSRDVDDAAKRSRAYFGISNSVIRLMIEHFNK